MAIDEELKKNVQTASRAKREAPWNFAFVDGTEKGLLVERRKVSEADAKKEYKSGTVYLGRCFGEEGTLVMETLKEPKGGMGAAVKKAIKAATGLNLDVVVRIVSSLNEEQGGTESQTEETTPTAPPPPPPPPPPKQPDSGAARFATRLKMLPPVLSKAEATGSPLVGQAKAKIGEANKLYVAKKYDEANASLDDAERFIKEAIGPGGGAPGVNFAKSRLTWETAKKTAGSQLASLSKAALAEFPELGEAVKKLDGIVGRFNEGLGDALDDVYTAADADKRKTAVEKALNITFRYLNFVKVSKLIDHVEKHPFENVKVNVRATLLPPLQQIEKQLKS